MGKLSPGTVLDWSQTTKISRLIQDIGSDQLLALWKRERKRVDDDSLWGDEIEYMIVNYDEATKKARLSLDAARLLESMAESPAMQNGHGASEPHYHPEASTFNLEATPAGPFGLDIEDLLGVEADMARRREVAKRYMKPDDTLISVPTFPRLGGQPFGSSTVPDYPEHGPVHRSQCVSDETVGPHARAILATLNLRKRREGKVQLNAPVFRDEHTPWPFQDPTINYEIDKYPEDHDVRDGSIKLNHIYMDNPSFAFGSAALQITMQTKNIEDARYLYDQLIPLGPVMLALTAGTPAYKGFLAATDARWNITCAGVDDRSPEERGDRPLQGDHRRIPKSRFGTNSTYISSSPRLRAEYHDPELLTNPRVKKKFLAGGMDDVMATHFAHLFIREPLITFVEDLLNLKPQDAEADSPILENGLNGIRDPSGSNGSSLANGVNGASDINGYTVPGQRIYATAFTNPSSASQPITPTAAATDGGALPALHPDSTEYFEKIQSSNWQHVRFKPPPAPPSATGWRVEFRIMEAQLTDFENAAFGTWIMLLSRAILAYDVNLYIPMARVAEDIDRAHTVDAVRETKFRFRRHIFGDAEGPERPVEDESELKSVDEIINGDHGTGTDGFPGLAPLVRRYVAERYADADPAARRRLGAYLDLVEGRASGRVETLARWMRRFVRAHPEYQKDSVINERIGWDLMVKLRDITNGEPASFYRVGAEDRVAKIGVA